MTPPLLGAESVWLLFSGDSHQSEDYLRFVNDVFFALQCLLKAGVPAESVYCFIDFVPGSEIDSDFKKFGATLYRVQDFQAEVKKLKAKAIVFASTGHGNFQGIAGVNHLAPVPLVDELRTVAGAEIVLLVLAQCYAGIFDYLELKGGPDTVIMGATRLHESISTPDLGLKHSANIFWSFFFDWLVTPIDVDADGKLSVADAYKHAALKTNDKLKTMKVADTISIEEWCLKETKDLQAIADPIAKADKEAKLKKRAGLYHTHQEPWMLNANASRKILFKPS